MSDKTPVSNSAKKPAKPRPQTVPDSSGNDIAALNVKLDTLIELNKAIDWKMWVYLKANKYIE